MRVLRAAWLRCESVPSDLITRPRSSMASTGLMAEGLDTFRLLFPKGEDANSYARMVKPAEKSLGVVIRAAQWLGNGERPELTTRCLNSVHQWVDGDEVLQTAVAPAASEAAAEPVTPLAVR